MLEREGSAFGEPGGEGTSTHCSLRTLALASSNSSLGVSESLGSSVGMW